MNKLYSYTVQTSLRTHQYIAHEFDVNDEEHLQISKNDRVIAYFKEWLSVEEKPID